MRATDYACRVIVLDVRLPAVPADVFAVPRERKMRKHAQRGILPYNNVCYWFMTVSNCMCMVE